MKNFPRCIFSVTFILVLFTNSTSCQTPSKYWSFDSKDMLRDVSGNELFDTSRYKARIKVVQGINNSGVDLLGDENSLVITNGIRSIKDQITISFFFKGQKFKYQSIPKPEFLIQFGYPFFYFNTTTINDNKINADVWKIDLKGNDIESYDYYADDNWHQLVFTVNVKSGVKKLFVDGKTIPSFTKEIKKGSHLIVSESDGFRNTDFLDEVAFYNTELGSKFISTNYNKFIKTVKINQAKDISGKKERLDLINGYDIYDFAPGYPSYTIQALDQLKKFPDPRFSSSIKLSRNFPWMDITYLHRVVKSKGGKGFGDSNPEKAVELAKELYDRWNYYFEIPILRVDKALLDKSYSNNNSVPGALVNFARRNPELKTSSIIMQVQGKPVHAGFNLSTPFVTSQNLAAKYYLKDQKGNPIKQKDKFWLSPLAPLDIIYNDAKTTSFYLKNVQKYLGRPIDMINENGEYFGHIRSKNLLESDPDVKRDIAKRDLNIYDYNGWFQNKLDTAYKNEILRNLNWRDTRFTFYNVAAIQAEYWPSYSFRRTSNDVIGNNHYSTPNFYPARPENWRTNAGPYNGYGIIADGRKREIQLGDKFFAPFVSAGWSFEEDNIRPAQWLALLKSIMMLGAEYFHVGYFNITGRNGWPDGKGPFDPRGYIYQAAMPSYVQALASRVFPFLEKGILLNPQDKLQSNIYSYRFKGLKENHLINVRKLNNYYLIAGSIQPISNIKGNVPDNELTEVILDGEQLTFEIRRQGSVYIYFKEGDRTVFYQIDNWHQKEHPYFWDTDFLCEAELADNLDFNSKNIITENFVQNSNSVSFVRLNMQDYLEFNVGSKMYDRIFVKAKALSHGKLTIQYDDFKGNIDINSKNWKWYSIEIPKRKSLRSIIKIKVSAGHVDVDQILNTNKTETAIQQKMKMND